LKESINSITEAEIIVGKDEYKAVSALMEGYISAISLQSSQVVVDSTAFKNSIKDEVEKWKTKEIEIIKKIEAKRTNLETQGIKLDISFIRKVTKDVSDYEAKLKELKLKETQFKELVKDRNKILNERKDNLDELYNERYKFIHTVNLNLKGSVVDYEVELRIEKQNLSPELAEIIKTAMGYRSKGDSIVEGISYFDLVKAIYKSDKTVFTNLKNASGQQIFSEEETLDIVSRLKNITTLGQIERVVVKDKPFIKIKKIVSNTDGTTTVLERDFSKLSMGQQQSILLTLLLYSKRNCPLIIDQPEDNLDSEFIYKTLVKNLKRIKEHRQVIIVTHNANIAVLGDSELIIPLKSTNEKTSIVDRGSIDNNKTNKTACGILEGGETAFRKRQSIYNL
jgi:ABC-type lipoprotein export system ATPase subunit